MIKYYKKFIAILINAIPIILMVGLIPVIKNDYWLTAVYLIIIIASLFIKYEKNDLIYMIFGFCIMVISEYFFISTGVEIFIRKSLFGVMPVWLPFLWAYGFLAIKRANNILEK